jgi:uncharacterized protein YkwD
MKTSMTAPKMVKVASLAFVTLVVACGGQSANDEALPEPLAAQPAEVGSSVSALTTTPLSTIQAQMLAAVNTARATGRNCGTTFYKAAPPLVRDARLDSVAQAHSADMAKNNYFSHNSLDGKSPFDRMEAAGYSFSTAGENIAAGYPDVAHTMGQWLSSPGHCSNIMNPAYKNIGIGFAQNSAATYTNYWTQDFGAPL